jgi:acetoacetyl-CoA synthetase
VRWSDFGQPARALEFEQLPFDQPLYILYSSGTTGVPKCIVHGAGGTLLQHQKEHLLHTDIRRSDRVFYFTTCGWMMWNWLASVLATGATVVLYEGSPFHPGPGCALAPVSRRNASASLEPAPSSSRPARSAPWFRTARATSAPGAILSTGSPLLPESFDYVYRHFKDNVLLASISGGTDIVSCFALGNPLLPVYRGELQCRGLGMKVEVYDDEGRSGSRRTRRARLHGPVSLHAGRLLERRGWAQVPRGLFRALPERLAPRRLCDLDRARRLW